MDWEEDRAEGGGMSGAGTGVWVVMEGGVGTVSMHGGLGEVVRAGEGGQTTTE